jgi:hypothetical protein
MSEHEKQRVSFATLFHRRNFALLWAGALASTTGSTTVTLAFDWYVFVQTHPFNLTGPLGQKVGDSAEGVVNLRAP